MTPLSTILALIRSIVVYIVIGTYVLVVGPPAILIAIACRVSGLLFMAARPAVRLALAIVGIRYRASGLDRIPPGGVVFCANHQSNVDPPVLFLTLHRRLRMLYKIEFDKIPILSHAMHVGRFVAVDRTDRVQAAAALERGATYVRDGLSFLVFAEGTRSRTGELLPFKKGGFIMAITAQAPIVPVAIAGARDAMRKGSAVIRPGAVTVRVGDPVQTRGMTIEDRDRLMADVRARIEELLAQGPI